MIGAFIELPHPGNPKDGLPVGYVIQESGCWDWVATPRKNGYAYLCFQGREVPAPRYVYELLVAAVPAGMVLDHLCRNRRCVNPAHLEPVTPYQNTMRGTSPPALGATRTHCTQGHRLGLGNVHPCMESLGQRTCRECTRIRARVRRRSGVPRGTIGVAA